MQCLLWIASGYESVTFGGREFAYHTIIIGFLSKEFRSKRRHLSFRR